MAMVAMVIGLAGLAVAWQLDFARRPLPVVVCSVAVLAGLFAMFDRRVKLAISDGGVRYSEWGPSVVPWLEFSGFHRATWRGQPYLELLPRRAQALVASFSKVGRINHRGRKLLRMPPFGIAVNALGVSVERLEELVADHLPEMPAFGRDRSVKRVETR